MQKLMVFGCVSTCLKFGNLQYMIRGINIVLCAENEQMAHCTIIRLKKSLQDLSGVAMLAD